MSRDCCQSVLTSGAGRRGPVNSNPGHGLYVELGLPIKEWK